jgi:hypothetical protein
LTFRFSLQQGYVLGDEPTYEELAQRVKTLEQEKNLGIRDSIMKPVIKRDFAKIIRKVLDT